MAQSCSCSCLCKINITMLTSVNVESCQQKAAWASWKNHAAGSRWNEWVKTCLLFFKQSTCPSSEDHQNKWNFEKKIWLGWGNWVTVFQKKFLEMQLFRNIHFCIQNFLHFLWFPVQKVNQEQREFFPSAGASQHSRLFWLKGLIPSSGSMHYKRVLKTERKTVFMYL